MPYKRYSITPVAMGINTSSPELNTSQLYSPKVLNGRIDQNSFVKRWGYSLDRTLGGPVYDVVLYGLYDGTRYTLYLTDTDLCAKETGAGGTYSFKTQTYTTGTVSGISGEAVTGNGTSWAANVTAGDKFIIAADLTAASEPDAEWATVLSVGGDTSITLTGHYAGSTSGNYIIRKVYSVPTNERWSWAFVTNKFCFTNGNINMQVWNGTGNATDLDATNVQKARYCCEFANRLFVADLTISSSRSPITVKWSKEGDPTDWVDSTAGEQDFLETDDFITGLGRVGPALIVYKRDSIIVGSRTGNATTPVSYQSPSKGIGLVAPWSLVSFMGTNAWVGRDDFYMMNGDQPVSIGGSIRNKFFSEVEDTEVQRVFGYSNYNANEIYWLANTTVGSQRAYVWNYKTNQWTVNEYPLIVHGYGMGAI